MAFGTDAIDSPLIAYQAGTRRQAERSTIDLFSVRGVDIQIDKTGRRMRHLKFDTPLLCGKQIVLKPKQYVGTEHITRR